MKFICTSELGYVFGASRSIAVRRLRELHGGKLPELYDVWRCPDEAYVTRSGHIAFSVSCVTAPVLVCRVGSR